jgi:hypothetical protein
MLSKKFSMETSAVLIGYVVNDLTVVETFLANSDETRALWVAAKVANGD